MIKLEEGFPDNSKQELAYGGWLNENVGHQHNLYENVNAVWRPEDYDFHCTRRSPILEQNIWWKGNYELRYAHGSWLCRRKITKGNKTEYLVTFFLDFKDTEINFANDLFSKLK